ncbi:hypothetical protein BX666DRAFT_19495 [Dichotomocladium elegans]|nr:hypothetical protein BX666DRAFT_19495 [Dichotomocladium elegans]
MDGLAFLRDCPMNPPLRNSATNEADKLIHINQSLEDLGATWTISKQSEEASQKSGSDNDLDLSDDDDDAFYMVTAPPPSPQQPSMLDTVFAEKLTRSLHAVVSHTEQKEPSHPQLPNGTPAPTTTTSSSSIVVGTSWDHAAALDKLLRKVQRDGTVRKKKRMTHITTKLKARSLCNKTASELADAISMIQLSTSTADDNVRSS